MSGIEITTARKITITYDLAGYWIRAGSFAIDLIFMLVYLLLMELFVGIVLSEFINETLATWVLIYPEMFFYSLAFEIFNNGQTPAKKILGLRVVQIEGKRAAPIDFFVRWAFRVVDIWTSLGTVALLMITSSERNQRLGDLLSNLAVIKIRSADPYFLKRLDRMQNPDGYTPVYPQVIQMQEKDMVMVKTLLDRLLRYPNEGHFTAMEVASEKIADFLDIPMEDYPSHYKDNPFLLSDIRKKKVQFLQQLLKDYIILTR
ncbi:MAG TPA: RDD family protein [Bacteroidales bacterium]|nr:RDD family protein [Bacteroidales bacterium]HRZ48764.1 RDD family protein [Bacteroidales bacterium]